jgi:hypothetical protein
MQFGKIHKINKTLSTNTCDPIFQKEEEQFLKLNIKKAKLNRCDWGHSQY